MSGLTDGDWTTARVVRDRYGTLWGRYGINRWTPLATMGTGSPFTVADVAREFGPITPVLDHDGQPAIREDPRDEWESLAALRTAEAIAQAAREYVRIRRAHLDHGPLLSARKAAHDALIAAVEAERAEREVRP